jgi:hypothetical protein
VELDPVNRPHQLAKQNKASNVCSLTQKQQLRKKMELVEDKMLW